jgi:formylglycine-generating enzyme required for sulfatase activity
MATVLRIFIFIFISRRLNRLFCVHLHMQFYALFFLKTMKHIVLLILLFVAVWAPAQTVSDVRFKRVDKEVTVTYTLDKAADIRVQVSVDGGVTFGNYLENFSGDAGRNIQPGNKTILFYDLPDLREIPYLLDTAAGVCHDDTLIVFNVEVEDGSTVIRVGDVAFRMLQVAGGTFNMGCDRPNDIKHSYDADKPVHQVTVDTFYMSQYEVTQALWMAVMDNNPSRWQGNDSLPVEQVSYIAAQTFIARLSQMTGYRFRLPTEAEWEFAARGGVKSNGTIFPGTAKNLNDVGWYCVNSENITHPVGRKLPNELGLYDMAGNVLEWCSDWYGSYTESPQVNPRGPRQGDSRIQRGGCINSPSWGCAVSDRNWYLPDRGYGFCGFRLVLDSIEEPVPDDEY